MCLFTSISRAQSPCISTKFIQMYYATRFSRIETGSSWRSMSRRRCKRERRRRGHRKWRDRAIPDAQALTLKPCFVSTACTPVPRTQERTPQARWQQNDYRGGDCDCTTTSIQRSCAAWLATADVRCRGRGGTLSRILRAGRALPPSCPPPPSCPVSTNALASLPPSLCPLPPSCPALVGAITSQLRVSNLGGGALTGRRCR
jgi:hypothetical protein